MERQITKAFSGVNKSVSRRLLPDHMVGDVKNLIFDDGTTKRRMGYSTVGSNLPLYGDLVNFFFFEKLSTVATYLLAMTTRDVYYYSGGAWLSITPRIATITYGGLAGTASTVSCPGTATVTCSAADWIATETGNDGGTWLIAEDVAGTGDPLQTGLTWYTISDITSTTQLTLVTGSYPTWLAGTNYILRKCFQSSESTYENIIDYQVVIIGSADNAVIFTTGVDNVYYFKDSTDTPTLEFLDDGSAAGLTNSTTLVANYTAEHVEYFNDVVFLANLTTGGTKYPTDLMWNEQGDPTDWVTSDLTSGTLRLTRDMSEIARMVTFKNRLYIMKENSITEVSISNDTFNPFIFNEERVTGTGCIAGRTVQLIEGNFVIFLGNDNIYAFDGINLKVVGDAINKYLFSNMNMSMLNGFFSATMKEKGLYLLFVAENPSVTINKCYVFDYKQQSWTIWEFAATMTGAGDYVSDTAEAWSDVAAGVTVASIAGAWSDSTTSADASLPILGDNAGNVYIYDESADDDNGTDIDTLLDTSDFDADDPKNAKHWKETTFTAAVESAGYVRIRVSPDFGTNWAEWITVQLTGEGLTQTLTQNWRQRGKQLRVQIENIDGSYFEMEDLILGLSGAGIKIER